MKIPSPLTPWRSSSWACQSRPPPLPRQARPPRPMLHPNAQEDSTTRSRHESPSLLPLPHCVFVSNNPSNSAAFPKAKTQTHSAFQRHAPPTRRSRRSRPGIPRSRCPTSFVRSLRLFGGKIECEKGKIGKAGKLARSFGGKTRIVLTSAKIRDGSSANPSGFAPPGSHNTSK
jgi:hypothetical protein